MSWVSTSKLDSLSKSFRNKFATKSLTIADAEKTSGVNISNVGSNGNITITPSSYGEDYGTELYLGGAAGSNNMQLTNGSISVVDSTGSRGITLSTTADNIVLAKDGSGTLRVSGVSDPTDNNDAVNKSYVDRFLPTNMSLDVTTSIKASAFTETEDTAFPNCYEIVSSNNTLSLEALFGHKGYCRIIASIPCDIIPESYRRTALQLNSYIKFRNSFKSNYNVRVVGKTSDAQSYVRASICNNFDLLYNEKTANLKICTNYFPFDFSDAVGITPSRYEVLLRVLVKVTDVEGAKEEITSAIDGNLTANIDNFEYIITE